MNEQYPLAVLADIHGNADALAAVLHDAKQRGASRFVNLGDTFYGPLDPAGTWRMLRDTPMDAVLGNQDRILLDPDGPLAGTPTFRAVREALDADGLKWLAALPATRITDECVFLCHGTPASDTAYLLEDVSSGRPAQRHRTAIETDLAPVPVECTLVLAGHSHHQGLAACGRITVVNPGSVGLPAYDDDMPPHAMASGSPHARYALVSPSPAGWDVRFMTVAYDWERAARQALANGRSDWARWLMTGLA